MQIFKWLKVSMQSFEEFPFKLYVLYLQTFDFVMDHGWTGRKLYNFTKKGDTLSIIMT